MGSMIEEAFFNHADLSDAALPDIFKENVELFIVVGVKADGSLTLQMAAEESAYKVPPVRCYAKIGLAKSCRTKVLNNIARPENVNRYYGRNPINEGIVNVKIAKFSLYRDTAVWVL